MELIPYMMVVGEKDAQNGTVTVRDRLDGDLGAMPTDEAMAKLHSEVLAKTVRQVAASDGPPWSTVARRANIDRRRREALGGPGRLSPFFSTPRVDFTPM